MSFTKANKQRQIRKKVVETEETTTTTTNDLDSNNNNISNTSNIDNNGDNEETTTILQPTKSIIGGTSGILKKKSGNTFSTKKSTSNGTISGTSKSLNLFSFDDDGENNDDGGAPINTISGSIKVNPAMTLKRNDIQFEDSKAVTMKSESINQYTNEMLNNLKKTTTSKPIKWGDKDKDNENENENEKDQKNKMDIDIDTKSSSTFMPPTAEQIKLAKEKRQRVRDGKFIDTDNATTSGSGKVSTSRSLSKDFLPLKVTDNDDNQEERSRLVREDDDDDEEEEIYNIKSKSTIKFGDPGKTSKKDIINNGDDIEFIDISSKSSDHKQQQQQQQPNKSIIESDDEDFEQEDEELTRWRLDQIKKGGGMKSTQQQQQQHLSIDENEYQRKKIEREILLGQNILDNTSSPKPSSNNNSSTYLELILKDLNSSLINLNEIKYSHQSELEKIQEALRDTILNLSQLESNQRLSQDQIIYFDELKQYSENMTDCLSEKIPQIEKLEDRYIELLKDHSHDLRKQLKLEIQDNLEFIQENEPNLNNNNNNNNKQINKDDGNQDDSQDDDNENLDEFGRDRSYFEKASRDKRMQQYKLKYQSTINNNNNNNNQIVEEEEEEDTLYNESDEKYYLNEKLKVLELIKQAMIDVDPEYSDIMNIKEKFEYWKSKDLKSYQKAQMPYIMPSIFAPFVRLQMIEWSPLSSITFDQLKWYSDLFGYGLNDNQDKQQSRENQDIQEDQDNNLIAKLIEKIVIPKVELFITFIWDPFSSKQTNNLISCIDKLLIYIDKNDQDIKLLFNSIQSTLKYTLDDSISLIPFSNQDLTFSINYFKKCMQLLNNFSKFSKFSLEISNNIKIQLIEFSDEIINISILPFLNKLLQYSNNNNNNNHYYYLFELFNKYLINLQWSNKNYKEILDNFLNQIKK